MSIRGIELDCDTPDCGAYCSISGVTSADRAREFAAGRWEWSHRNGRDFCGPCSRGGAPHAPHSHQEPR